MTDERWREMANKILAIRVSDLAKASTDLYRLTVERHGPSVTAKRFRLGANLFWRWPDPRAGNTEGAALQLWNTCSDPSTEHYLEINDLLVSLNTPGRVVQFARHLVEARTWCLERVDKLHKAWNHDQGKGLAALEREFAVCGLVTHGP